MLFAENLCIHWDMCFDGFFSWFVSFAWFVYFAWVTKTKYRLIGIIYLKSKHTYFQWLWEKLWTLYFFNTISKIISMNEVVD